MGVLISRELDPAIKGFCVPAPAPVPVPCRRAVCSGRLEQSHSVAGGEKMTARGGGQEEVVAEERDQRN